MDDPARRRLLASLAAGTAGLLAGCGAPAQSDESTPTPDRTPTPSPTPTPTPAPDVADYRTWLPAPAALTMEPYALGALDLEALREAGLDQRNLSPGRYTPGSLSATLPATASLVTLSTADAAGGVLEGEYDPDAVGSTLADADFEAATDGDAYTRETMRVDVGDALLLWADAPQAGSILETLRGRHEGDGTTYEARNPRLSAVLDRLAPAWARFARPVSGGSDGPFADARFLGTGIWASAETVRWRTVLAFEGTPPDEAESRYRTQFEDKQGFEAVETAIEGEVLRLDAETSPAYATSTQPI